MKFVDWLKEYKAELFIFSTAFLVRFILYLKINDVFLFENPILDAKYYFDWALEIFSGDWFSENRGVFVMSPGYPYFLAVLFKLFSIKIDYIVIVQILLGSFSCVLVYLMSLRFVEKKLAVLSGLLMGFYGVAIFYDMMVLKTSLYQSLSVLFIFLIFLQIKSGKIAYGFFAGLIVGFLVQLRPYALLMIGVTAFVYVYMYKKDNIRKMVLSFTVFFLGALLFLLPVGLRNLVVGGEFVLSTAHGGMNFYTGNNRFSKGPYTPLPFARTDPEFEQRDFYEQAKRSAGRELTNREADRFWYKEALRFVIKNPFDWIGLTGKKFLIYINTYEPPINVDYYFFREYYEAWKYFPLISFGFIAPFGIIGIIFWSRGSREKIFLLVYFLAYFASNMIFFVVSEYRYPVMPVLVIFSVVAVSGIMRSWNMRQFGRFYILAGTCIFAVWICNFDIYSHFFGLHTYKRANLANSFFGLGVSFESESMHDEAVGAYRKSIEIMPQDSSLVNLGSELVKRGELKEAERLLLQAIKLKYSSYEAHNNLGSLYYNNGRYEDACKEFSVAVRLNPYSETVKRNLEEAKRKFNASHKR